MSLGGGFSHLLIASAIGIVMIEGLRGVIIIKVSVKKDEIIFSYEMLSVKL